jgi:hypothetical protein
MRLAFRRTAVRSALVLFTLGLCLLGPVRPLTWLPGYHDVSVPTLAAGNVVSNDNAVVERSGASTLTRWAQWLETAAAGLLWLLSTGVHARIVRVALATSWHRRAPPYTRHV